MSVLKLYNDRDLYEWLKDGYFDNNSLISNEEVTPSVYFETTSASVTFKLLRVDKDKLKAKVFEEDYIKSWAGSVSNGVAYLAPQAYDVPGIYTFHISVVDGPGYSELFCINAATAAGADIKTMEGGVLKFYDKDYFEFSKDGYFDNNTLLLFKTVLPSFWFDVEASFTGSTSRLYKIDKDKLKVKELSETRVQSISVFKSGTKAYFERDYFDTKGIYRYKTTINAVDYYSDLFCVHVPPKLGTVQFADGTYIQFADGTFMDFAN